MLWYGPSSRSRALPPARWDLGRIYVLTAGGKANGASLQLLIFLSPGGTGPQVPSPNADRAVGGAAPHHCPTSQAFCTAGHSFPVLGSGLVEAPKPYANLQVLLNCPTSRERLRGAELGGMTAISR